MAMEIITTCGNARRGVFETPHGTVQTPAFMNVATCGAIKGAVSAYDLKDIKCQVQLCNTYLNKALGTLQYEYQQPE